MYNKESIIKPYTIIFPGIGVDDMFVIVQAWDNLPPEVHKNRDVAERIGLALKHAVSTVDYTGDERLYLHVAVWMQYTVNEWKISK